MHLAFIPSHPFGYTAGKWREWYPDVVAEDGKKGIVVNQLLSSTKGTLTTDADKYLWQDGWFMQHQRLIKSGSINLKNEVKTFLVGSVGSSSAGWPSFARGIMAESPQDLVCKSIYKIREENGFTLFKIKNNKVLAEIISCGSHDPENKENGAIVSKNIVYI